jgi:phage FluMu gp28-like protein
MADGTLRPLSSTLRTVEWDELPASVRDVPDGFNPLASGVLMAHQTAFLKIHASIKVAEKGRRTGITFAVALDCTIKAASRKSAGGDNIFYIGDTKEKGLEFIGYCAKFARVIAQAQGQGVSGIEEFLFEDQDEKGQTRHITSYRIRFASGFQITALSSRPANIRGLQGTVVIDEAAFHPDVQGVLDAATALLIWGGEIIIISSHNGRSNPFNQLIKDIQEGRYGEDAKVFTVTFDDAVANGIYERVCMMKGWTADVDGKLKWYTKIRNSYGTRKAAMREELDAIPRDGNGVCIPGVWIDQAMVPGRTVLRLALDDSFTNKSNAEREAFGVDWIERYLKPELAKLDPTLRHVFAQDFARHRDFSIAGPMAIHQDMRRSVPFVIEMNNVPARQQEQIVWTLIDALPRRCGGAMDATGSGETFAEYTGDKYGSSVHQIKLSRNWYGMWMPKLIQGHEDGVIDYPADADLGNDVRAIEDVDGIPQITAARRKDLKDPDLHRHGDFAVFLVLAWFATVNLSEQYAYQAVPTRHKKGTDLPDRTVRLTAGFKTSERAM